MSKKLLALAALPFLFATTNSYACDDKPCESAYLASTHQYIKNGSRRANAVRSEHLEYLSNFERQFIAVLEVRRTHARNRERRNIALYKHFHSVLATKEKRVSYKIAPKQIAKSNNSKMI